MADPDLIGRTTPHAHATVVAASTLLLKGLLAVLLNLLAGFHEDSVLESPRASNPPQFGHRRITRIGGAG
jgi:hypothetical protein